MQSLSHLLQRLADSGVDFVVIGGFAGVLHGSALVTRDLDICAVLIPFRFLKYNNYAFWGCLRRLFYAPT
jgi:hypothetical protein